MLPGLAWIRRAAPVLILGLFGVNQVVFCDQQLDQDEPSPSKNDQTTRDPRPVGNDVPPTSVRLPAPTPASEPARTVKTREEQIQERIAEKQRTQCEKWRDDILEKNPKARRLMEALKVHGCGLDPKEHIKCLPCHAVATGGFGADYGILLCQNQFISKDHLAETLIHELVHAYDHCVFKYKWMDCKHFACTEVRAAHLSGDCGFVREVQRGFLGFKKHGQECIRRRAILATKYNPHCAEGRTAEDAVDAVFESCLADTQPFEREEL
ncbi:hypothetical protein AMAG_00715 [Allomyces macrogynus ATCC 38327]|uniref:Mitochondrial inner membrane protease ATP23 n=1 Tax=Allomyces macrogynus (strain ATCC 38327) TaxID=578462 RepID=A0A0L0RX90_ALLM3|nr:hypothetical protein AMAG_00715 [Allomyces macrogynus ATCC 38327]|eukprot:KNE54760.1 hypothetical protein AMAG_00715 [Allomyces macrogynus ATCC 38327]